MSGPSYCLLLLSTALILLGNSGYFQAEGRVMIVPRRFSDGAYLMFDSDGSRRNHLLDVPSSSNEASRILAKRGPELFFPYMEA